MRGSLSAGSEPEGSRGRDEDRVSFVLGPGCAHHPETLFAVILHHLREEAFVSAWHQHICLETLTLLGCVCSRIL